MKVIMFSLACFLFLPSSVKAQINGTNAIMMDRSENVEKRAMTNYSSRCGAVEIEIIGVEA